MTTVEFIGMIHHRQASEIHPPQPVVLDRGYIREFAQAAEAGGFDRVLVGYFRLLSCFLVSLIQAQK